MKYTTKQYHSTKRYLKDALHLISSGLLLGLPVVLSGCDLNENRTGCPTVGAVELSFDWTQVPDGTGSPSDMSVYFYPAEGSAITCKTDDKGGIFPLPRGDYRLLVFNEDAIAVSLNTDENGLENNIVSVIPVEAPSTGHGMIGISDEPYIGQPSTLYSVADVNPDIFVEVGELVEKTIQPENHIRQAKIIAHINGDLAEVTACSFEVTGLVQSLCLATYTPQGNPATVAGEAIRNDRGYSRLFTMLGKHESVPSYALVHLDCQSQAHYDFQVDISEVLRKINEPGVMSTTITLDFELFDNHENEYDVRLVSWEYVFGGYLDASFNE